MHEQTRQRIYELLPDENLKKVLEYAGGALPTTYLERVQVNHIIPFQKRVRGEFERTISDINFRNILNENREYALADGDVISLFPIDEGKENYVTAGGAVSRPGTYQLEKVSTLRQPVTVQIMRWFSFPTET